MKKTLMNWTATAAITAGITLVPTVTHASASDNSHDSSEEPMNQQDDAMAEHGLLMEGAQGEKVTTIQQELNDRGIATTVDGIYGPATENSVMLFQNSYNLAVDGIVGPNTQEQLDTDSTYPNMLLMEGDNNVYVSQVQQRLNERGIDTMVDGIYGPQTKANVMAYQERNQLSTDGIVGPYTWDLLFPPEDTEEEEATPMISSSDEAIELLKNNEDFGEDIVFEDFGGELQEDEQGFYYQIQLSSKDLMEDGGTGTVDEFNVYQNGDYESTYGDSE